MTDRRSACGEKRVHRPAPHQPGIENKGLKTMKKAALATIFLLTTLLFPAGASAAGLGELRLSAIQGAVQIRTADTLDWSLATINFPLRGGDQLWVPEGGWAEVESRRGSIIRLDERTALDVLTVDDDALQFYLDTGQAYVNTHGERGTTLQLDTPHCTIRVYERSKFGVDVANDGVTDISVFRGAVSAETRQGGSRIESGTMLSLGEHWAHRSPLGRFDAWERWNETRDQAIEGRRRSVRYLPEDLAGYSADFDNHGEWVDLPSYGYVWRPSVQVEADWSPYHHGRWVWIGDDYVWIAQESWGWAPYHYGRWAFVPRHGWCWVPPARNEVYWGPGYVGWVHTPTYVAWVPLGPREVYYGHGNYGPHSVDTRHIDVNRVSIKLVYQNVRVRNAVTALPNETFIRGRQVNFKVEGNPFLKEKISVGQPRIAPERETRRPSLREIPQAKAPPDRIREIRIDELRNQRRLVKQQDQSVFLPEQKPPTLKIEEHKQPRSKTPRSNQYNAAESRSSGSPVKEDARQPAVERRSPPEPALTPAKNRSEDRQNTGRSPAPAPREDVQPVPAERVSPAKRGQEQKQNSQLGGAEKQPIRKEGSSQNNGSSRQPSSPREEVQSAPAKQVPPPMSGREYRQQPQVETKEQPSSRDESGRQLKNTRSTRPEAPGKAARSAPSVTRERTKAEGAASKSEDKNQVQRKHPPETREGTPEECASVYAECKGAPEECRRIFEECTGGPGAKHRE
jgi:Family of unknown function (DUF6600)/FecR protein